MEFEQVYRKKVNVRYLLYIRAGAMQRHGCGVGVYLVGPTGMVRIRMYVLKVLHMDGSSFFGGSLWMGRFGAGVSDGYAWARWSGERLRVGV